MKRPRNQMRIDMMRDEVVIYEATTYLTPMETPFKIQVKIKIFNKNFQSRPCCQVTNTQTDAHTEGPNESMDNSYNNIDTQTDG